MLGRKRSRSGCRRGFVGSHLDRLETRVLLSGSALGLDVGSALPSNAGTFTDTDGDVYTIKLTGPGTVDFVQSGPDVNGDGSIDSLTLAGTTSKSALSVTVKKNKNGGDGLVSIGSISGTTLKSITASSSDLIGSGLDFTGQAVGSVKLRDVLNGAEISAGVAGQSISLTVRTVGDGTDMTFGGTVSSLKAAAIGAGEITAPVISKISVGGTKGITGNMASDVTLSGPAGATVLGSLTVAGTLSNVTIQGGVGNLGTIKAGAMLSVGIFAGINGTTLPNQLSDFTTSATIKGVTISGITGQAVSMSDLQVAARFITALAAKDPDPTNGESQIVTDKLSKASLSFVNPNTGKRGKISGSNFSDPLDSKFIDNINVVIL
jgi:hypothetical protein